MRDYRERIGPSLDVHIAASAGEVDHIGRVLGGFRSSLEQLQQFGPKTVAALPRQLVKLDPSTHIRLVSLVLAATGAGWR